METIAQRISRARRYLNLNQKELAKRANITEASLSRYENGLREPKSAVLSRLADALEVSTDYLLGLTDERTYDECDITKRSEKDIKNILENAEEMLKQDGLMFCGKPASKEAIDGVLQAIKMGMLLAIDKEKNK
ncbi:helix-turn-helix domain-containing protein [Romboutsia sp. 1001216sp1]|uniref:helix-turn-helix domain-containing protein n=1 Tax=unclassified Romboutsia TaxID=2626894 RepID=UPI0018A0481E|nr:MULTISPECIES: helix-turn-helix domain-containing protein [unclassified Romboutsia]MDB8789639.1 helix-turn-helix domain-containing protein [Romboutsia sp. 1001216sp1]MDB8801787.1 helix-turn-helix domain-containing protein [Romboutsia sp. 1001216sp1]MDB8813184.1 helix-turn-helix domain-containing protein [Romboutsia sp. 1001216sp1]